jgi:hypothetical protein
VKALAVAAAFATLAICVIGVKSAPAVERDVAFERAHRAAVKYRRQRDDLQQRLTRRVREARRLRRSLARRPSSIEAVRLAAVVYGVSPDLLYRIASCESTGGHAGLNTNAKNPTSTAAGLAQALDSTWAASPFRRFSRYSAYASALFMGREVSLGHLWQWAASKGCWA